MEIIYNLGEKNNKDILICLCEYSVVLLDIENFQIITKHELSNEAVRLYIDYFNEDKGLRILLLGKNYINIFQINFNDTSKYDLL